MAGNIFVISAPSGTGKTTIIKRVLKKLSGISLAVSYTTRAPREGEKEGRDYCFVSKPEFEAMAERGQFVEWAEYASGWYGTPKEDVDEKLGVGDVLLDIDTQGAAKVKMKCPDAVLIFIMPPSFDDLFNRLKTRGSDTEDNIEKRIEIARKEMSRRHEYDYQVVNEDLDEACEEVIEIIKHHRE